MGLRICSMTSRTIFLSFISVGWTGFTLQAAFVYLYRAIAHLPLLASGKKYSLLTASRNVHLVSRFLDFIP